MTPPDHYDVVILSDGLAGGCLGARQLHIEAPALHTLVIEKRSTADHARVGTSFTQRL